MCRSLTVLAIVAVAAACYHISPAAKSPLKEKLAPLTEPQLEELVGVCLEKMGWKVDHFPRPFGDAERVRATKKGIDAAVYVYPVGQVPRITGDMAEGADAFWKCLDDATK